MKISDLICCNTCQYLESMSDECRRNPPVITDKDNVTGYFPYINDCLNTRCGEYNKIADQKILDEMNKEYLESCEQTILNGWLVPWVLELGFSTGHAETISDLLLEVGPQIRELQKQ